MAQPVKPLISGSVSHMSAGSPSGTLFPIKLSANVQGKAAKESPNGWAFAPHRADLDQPLHAFLLPASVLAIVLFRQWPSSWKSLCLAVSILSFEQINTSFKKCKVCCAYS